MCVCMLVLYGASWASRCRYILLEDTSLLSSCKYFLWEYIHENPGYSRYNVWKLVKLVISSCGGAACADLLCGYLIRVFLVSVKPHRASILS